MDIGPIVRWLLRQKSEPAPDEEQAVEQRAENAKAGAQAIADKLPATVMPHAGLAEDKRRKAMIEKQWREGAE